MIKIKGEYQFFRDFYQFLRAEYNFYMEHKQEGKELTGGEKEEFLTALLDFFFWECDFSPIEDIINLSKAMQLDENTKEQLDDFCMFEKELSDEQRCRFQVSGALHLMIEEYIYRQNKRETV